MVAYDYAVRNRMIWLSFAVFAVSMFLPMHYIGWFPDSFDYESLRSYTGLGGVNDVPVPSGMVFIFGPLTFISDVGSAVLLGRIPYRLIWILNIVYFAAVYRLWNNNASLRTFRLISFSVVIILLFYLCHFAIGIPLKDDYFPVTRKGSGYFCWLLSFMILLTAMVYDRECKLMNRPGRKIIRIVRTPGLNWIIAFSLCVYVLLTLLPDDSGYF